MAHIPEFDLNQNIRNITKLDDTELRASMQKSGWLELFPAYADENNILIVGHRRMKIAGELGIKPVVRAITFGDGSEGAAKRLEASIASNIGHADLSKDDRARIAALAYQHGYTQAQIAAMLGVDQKTISRDLDGLGTMPKPHRPKGGRPKGSGRKAKPKAAKTEPKKEAKPVHAPVPKLEKRRRTADVLMNARELVRPLVLADDPLSYKYNDLEALHPDVASHVKFEEACNIERALRDEPMIDVSTLSKTAQEKVTIACKQALRRQEAEVWAREHAHAKRWLDEQLTEYRENERHYEIVTKARSGFMKKVTFNKIRMALHPDTYQNVSIEDRNELVQEWEGLKKAVLNEAESPTRSSNLPKTVEELLRRAAEKKNA